MTSTPQADGDRGEAAREDILDTDEAGPRVIRGSLLQLAGYVVGTIATVASSAVVIRHLGKTDTGRFLTVTALITIVTGASELGLGGVATREYAADRGRDGHRYLSNLLGIRLVLTIVGLFVATAFAVAVGYATVAVQGTLVLGACAFGIVAQQSWSIPLTVQLRFGWIAGIQLAMQVGIAIEAVLLALAGAGLLPFFALQMPVVVPALVVTAMIGGRDARVAPAFELEEWRRMVSRIVPYSIAVVLSIMYFRIAQILVSVLSTTAQTAEYGVPFRVLEALTAIPPLLVSTALPVLARAARDDFARFGYVSRRLLETALIAGGFLVLAVFLGARVAIDVIAGAGYAHSVVVLRILVFALLGTFVIGARGYALLSLDRLRAMMVSNIVALVVVLVVGGLLASADGAIGAAIGMLAAELSLAVCYEIALSYREPALRVSAGLVARVAACMVAAGAVPLALSLSPIPAAAVGEALYVIALLALGLIPPEIRHALTSRPRAKATCP